MQDKKGFTLIELLIVVVIIGILAAIAIPKFSATREKAYYAALKSDIKNLASQEEIYYSDNYTYTTDTSALGFAMSTAVTVTIDEATSTGWAASATHSGLDAADGCGMKYGDASDPSSLPANVTITQAGEVACSG